MFFYVSDFNNFLFCKRKFVLSKKVRIKTETKVTRTGSAFHEALEYFYNNEPLYLIKYDKPLKPLLVAIYRKLKNNAINYVLKKYKNELKDKIENLHNILNLHIALRVKQIYSYSSKNNIFAKELIQSLEPKILTEVSIKDYELMLSGRIDLLEIYKNEIVPVEFKTGKKIYKSYELQAISYGLMLKHNKNSVKKVKIYLPSETKEIILNPFHEIEIKNKIKEMQEALENMPKPKDIPYCKICPYRNYCGKSNP